MKNKFLSLFAFAALAFTGCLKEDPNPAKGTPSPLASIEVMRALYKGADVSVTADKMMGAYKISGIVISDPAGKNIEPGVVVIQNTARGNTRGITLALSDAAAVSGYALGDSLVVDLTGTTLSNVKGTLQVTGLSSSKITKAGSGIAVKPRQVTLGELDVDFAKFESTLVEVNADVTPTPAPGETYTGSKNLFDGTDANVVLFTNADADFATRRVPASAAFTGIATWHNASANTTEGAVKQLRLRSIADVKNASGPLYPGFPEDFETPDASLKSSYNMTAIDNNIDLKTGNWKLLQAILGTTAGRDRFNPSGKQAIRMQQNLSTPGYVQMNFDLPNGATKLTLTYGAYYTDASSSWQLEYSIDGGENWEMIGDVISDAGPVPKVATFLMDIQGPVRFRVHKLGLGTTNNTTILNGRLSIEDIAVYQN